MAQEMFNRVLFVRFTTGPGDVTVARVRGRIAFPSKRGPQPKAGEIWRCKVEGENPERTVFFLTCIERVDTQARVAELLRHVADWEVDIDRACLAIAELKGFCVGDLDMDKIKITLRYFEERIYRRLGWV